MTNVLIVFATTHGHTGKIVAKLASAVEAEGSVTSSVNIEDGAVGSLDSFGAVIVAGSIHDGLHQKDLVEWVEANRAALDARPNLFISVSMAAADDTDEARETAKEYIEKFEHDTGWTPKRAEAIAGAIQFREYGVSTWILTKMFVRKKGHPADTSGNQDFTDWGAVDAVGREFAEALTPRSPTGRPGLS